MSSVTVGSETGTSIGIEGVPARIMYPILDKAFLYVVIAYTWNLNMLPTFPSGKFVTKKVFRLGKFLTLGSFA